MSITQTEHIELEASLYAPHAIDSEVANGLASTEANAPDSAVEAIPDGGYGWVVVFSCSVITFVINGWSGSWGVFQAALLESSPSRASTTTSLSFVGSLSIALCVALGLASGRLSRLIGARYSMLLGVVIMSSGILFSSFTVHDLGGLFGTAGISLGIGTSLTYTMSNTLPAQWFSSKLGAANGLVKLGGGLGATIMAIMVQALIDRVGLAWAFRIFGFISLATGIPAALLIRERLPPTNAPFIDLSLFKSIPFCALFLAGAIGTFALFVPSFFLPLFARSIGLSASTGAGIVAAFNACTALGRFATGFACDGFGATNTLLAAMALNALSMLAIWPVSKTLGPLVLFAALNGIANGAFFVAMPTAVTRILGPGRAAGGVSMAVTGWTAGYLMGTPIAGMLIAGAGTGKTQTVESYRAAIFYAGGVALVATAFVVFARVRMDGKLIKKV